MKILQPPGWVPPKGYAYGIAARGTQVFVGGQIGWNAAQIFDSDDFVAQAKTALANVVAVNVSNEPTRCCRSFRGI